MLAAIPQAYRPLMSTDKSSWPDEATLSVTSLIDGTAATHDSLANLLKEAGTKLRTLEIKCPAANATPALLELIAEFCPNITRLEIPYLRSYSSESLFKLSSECTKITYLTIDDRDQCFKDDQLSVILLFVKNLTALKLIGAGITKKCLDLLPESLTYLDIRNCKFLTVHSFSRIRERSPNITKFYASLFYDQNKLDDLHYHWPKLEALIVASNVSLDFKRFCHLKELFLNSQAEEVSINAIVNDLPQLFKLQLYIKSARDEVIFYKCQLKCLIIRTDEALPPDVILSLPYCTRLEALHVEGSDIHAVLEQLLDKCNALRYIKSFDTIVQSDTFERLKSSTLTRRVVMDVSMMK